MIEIVSVIVCLAVLAAGAVIGVVSMIRGGREAAREAAEQADGERRAREVADGELHRLQVDVERARRRGWTDDPGGRAMGLYATGPWPPHIPEHVRREVDEDERRERSAAVTEAMTNVMRAGLAQWAEALMGPRRPQ